MWQFPNVGQERNDNSPSTAKAKILRVHQGITHTGIYPRLKTIMSASWDFLTQELIEDFF